MQLSLFYRVKLELIIILYNHSHPTKKRVLQKSKILRFSSCLVLNSSKFTYGTDLLLVYIFYFDQNYL